MSLTLRFSAIAGLLMLPVTLAFWLSVDTLSEDIIEDWAVRYAEKQVLYDRERTLQPLIRELALSHQFAQSKAIIDFAHNPENDALRLRALREMENFRLNFLEMNYFVALKKSGEYFHNDANNTYQNNTLRYTLSPDNPADSWFYELIKQKRRVHINVNHDKELKVTKLWVDILLTDGNEILGVVGTGLNLNRVLSQLSPEESQGVTNIFVDHSGAIQLHSASSLVNLSSLTLPADSQHNVAQLLDNAEDKNRLKLAMADAMQNKSKVSSYYVRSSGKRTLMAIAYLPDIDWYEVTLIDIATLLPASKFSGVFIAFALAMLALIAMLIAATRRLILHPLQDITQAISDLENGKTYRNRAETSGILTDLSNQVSRVSDHFLQKQSQLESEIAHCAQLQNIAQQTDPLTGLPNRQAMISDLQKNQASTIGLMLINLDFTREINSRYGLTAGDQALKYIAGVVTKHVSAASLGSCGHWGGDEFIALVNLPMASQLLSLAESIRHDAYQGVNVSNSAFSVTPSVSIGACLIREGQDLNTSLDNLTKALSQAKAAGRNRVRLYSEPSLTLNP